MAYLTTRQAQQRLGISHTKMTQLIKDGILAIHRDPLDRRKKLIDERFLRELQVNTTVNSSQEERS